MRESGYKISAKSAALQFSIDDRDRRIVQRKQHQAVKRKLSRSTTEKKSKKVTKKKKKICVTRRKTKKPLGFR